MYVRPNYASKKLLKDAVEAGDVVEAFFSSPGHRVVVDGLVTVGGPRDSETHYLNSWFAQVVVEAGRVVKVIS